MNLKNISELINSFLSGQAVSSCKFSLCKEHSRVFLFIGWLVNGKSMSQLLTKILYNSVKYCLFKDLIRYFVDLIIFLRP